MAVTAQTGVLSFGGQSAKGTVASTFYKHRSSDIDLATISDDRIGPQEVGGIPTPTIPYRAGVMATGGATIIPRLESTMGWIFYGALGAASVTADRDVEGNTVTGMYNHEFTFATDQGYVPWMSFRKEVPGAQAADILGETFVDCKIIGLTVSLPNDGLIQSRVDVLGRTSEFEEAPSFSYANADFEDYESIPIGSVVGGYLKVPTFSATALPITQATVTISNQPLDIRQEKVYGSPYLEDVTVIGRQMTVDLVLKWTDPDLYQKILTGSTTGTQWVAQPFVQDLDILSLSSVDAGALATPYGMRIQAPSIMYRVEGGIRLAGGQAVMLRVTGTALASASDYVTVNIGNEVTQYSWPT